MDNKGIVFVVIIVAFAYFIYLPIVILSWRKDFRDKAAKKAAEEARAERQLVQNQQTLKQSSEEIAQLRRQVQQLEAQIAGESNSPVMSDGENGPDCGGPYGCSCPDCREPDSRSARRPD